MTIDVKDIEFLRNDFPVEIVVGGIKFPTVEHAFQAAKTNDDEVKEKISKAESVRDARSIGRTCSLVKDWDQRKVKIMEALVRQKFFTDDGLRDKLIDTGTAPIEMCRKGDDFWGIDDDGNGKNNLGRILMSIREEAQLIFGWNGPKEEEKPVGAIYEMLNEGGVNEVIAAELDEMYRNVCRLTNILPACLKASDLSDYFESTECQVESIYTIVKALATSRAEIDDMIAADEEEEDEDE